MVTIADADRGTVTTATKPPVFSRRVSCVPDTFVTLPRSRLSVWGCLFSVTLISACDHVPGSRGNGGTAAAPAVPARPDSESAAKATASQRMDELSPSAVISGLLFGKAHVKRPPAPEPAVVV